MSAKPSPRTRVPKVFNGLIWLNFCALAGTGLLLAWRLPPGSRGGRGLSALGWGRHDWGDLHTWLAYAFLALIVVHLALHWRWFWQIAARKRRWPLLLGVGGGLALIVAMVFLPVKHGPDDHDDHSPRQEQRRHRGGQE
ncbi:DUF4405 domain-containing protein [Haloferula sp. A504]|uniref:DUF4405 domain-containing protein n=1 Tax=Haloferula sp. A504 TaxID=3373601 RepID=UPI0031C6E86A|nr:DUF4405 domain-containing protein [Verrucomicrobiaceae bacterium E54]